MRRFPRARWTGPPIGSPGLAGRIAGAFFMAGGVFSVAGLVFPGPPDLDRTGVGLAGLAAGLVGLFAWLAPWDQWPRRATLWLVPAAFLLLSIGNIFSGYMPYSYSTFYFVVFVWLGIAYPPRTGVWFAPLAALSYVAPMAALPGNFSVNAGAAVVVIPT